jgi:hypothetical protein
MRVRWQCAHEAWSGVKVKVKVKVKVNEGLESRERDAK